MTWQERSVSEPAVERLEGTVAANYYWHIDIEASISRPVLRLATTGAGTGHSFETLKIYEKILEAS